MQELINKLGEVVALAELKVKELSDKIADTNKLGEQLDQLAQLLSAKEADLKVREQEVKSVEDVVALSTKNEADRKEVLALLAQNKVERDGFAAYLEVGKKEIADGHFNLKSKIENVENEKQNLIDARAKFLNEVSETKKQLEKDRASIDIERQKVIAQLGK